MSETTQFGTGKAHPGLGSKCFASNGRAIPSAICYPCDSIRRLVIKLLLADVDGTLVTHEKVLTERAKTSVAKMRAAGIEFAITSGRPPRGMEMLIEPLALTTPIAAFNGGMFVRRDLS